MSTRRRSISAGVLVVVAMIAMTLAFVRDVRDGSGRTSDAAALPTACENFAQASDIFARGGSAQALAMGSNVFTRDPESDSRQILRDLMDACDAERTSR